MINPFVIKAYQSKELFCDRKKELETLIRNFENDTDTTIISQRRMGKTGLIYRLLDEIKLRALDVVPVYVDIYTSRTMADFIKQTAEAVLKVFPEESSFGKQFMTFVKSLRPQISFDTLTGEVQLQIAYQTVQEKEHTLKELFEFLDRQNVRILLAYDEFQQIREYPEQNIEELLRTYMQPLKNIHFIFCGSKKHLMTDIFANAKKPFYSSTAFMALDKISSKATSRS
jgi:AAA+ ATPase superfamily predicted ATPase